MYEGYNKVFWGIFFITFHINLGPVTILSAFVGYLIISKGINILYEETEIDTFKKAQLLANILAARSIIIGVMELFSFNISDLLILNTLIVTVFSTVEMIMFYKLIEGSVEYFTSLNLEKAAHRNMGAARFYTIASIIGIISMNLSLVFHIGRLSVLALFILIILRIYLMVAARRNRNIFAAE